MIFADAGYFVAMLRTRDELRARALRWSATVSERLLLTDYVLVETANLLSNHRDRPKVTAWINQLAEDATFEVIPASQTLLDAGIAFHADREDKEWSLTDCISFLVMRERGLFAALAYDEHFVQAGFDALLRREPSP